MKFTCILNGCASNASTQARELNGFIDHFLSEEAGQASTILFHADKNKGHALLDLVPTRSVELVRIDRFQPETVLDALQRIESDRETALYLFPPGMAGDELAVRWAYRRKGSSLVQVVEMAGIGNRVFAKKKAYADHVLATFQLNRQPFCISPAKGNVQGLPISKKDNLQIIEHTLKGLNKDGFGIDYQWTPAGQASDLETVKLLIVGGRGLGTRENVQKLRAMAHAMGAAFGISRPVALNAWGGMHRLIGVSGTIARPEVCIAAGVSGAGAFYAGIEKSKFIIAINNDPQARIVKAADVAVIDDYKAVMEELLKLWDH